MEETTTAAAFFGYMGAAAAMCFCSLGAAYGTAKSAVGISCTSVMRPELGMCDIDDFLIRQQ